jgi:hypothetical protein
VRFVPLAQSSDCESKNDAMRIHERAVTHESEAPAFGCRGGDLPSEMASACTNFVCILIERKIK